MIQQCVLLRKENDLLNSLIGQSFNHKSKFEAGRILDEIHSKVESRTFGKKSLCYVVDKNEILGVGGSTLMKGKNGKIVSNLILDNYGLMLAAMHNGNPAGTTNASLTDDAGVGGRIISLFAGVNFVDTTSALGIVHRIGSGTTTPARSDFEVATGFGTAPESGDIDPSNVIFDSASGSFIGVSVIIAGGAGTINESVLKGKWRSAAGILNFALFRDIISPAVPFVASNTIILEYTIQL